jgi:hypothetical protein
MEKLMGTAKITEYGAFYDVEDADGDIHTKLTLDEVAELLDVEEGEVKTAIAEGQGGVGYIDVDDPDEEDLESDEDEEEDE